MRWYRILTGTLHLLMLPACPSEFGKDGRVGKAIHQDTVDLVIKRCSDDAFKKHCDGDKRNTEECRICSPCPIWTKRGWADSGRRPRFGGSLAVIR